ncbi:hypothetical protein O181_047940 [Austropuccinia psidii MF-1]|uniref:Uncharacterized protein n=1 Tax=Austropuccinia psidii MF-1 TaxID=1389203 RepID=A0A9Q3HNP7_9BASI|nr:hypothetical protein [Austropuccinia psidii MF-1]
MFKSYRIGCKARCLWQPAGINQNLLSILLLNGHDIWKQKNVDSHNVYDTSMVMEGKHQDNGVEEGDLDFTYNLSQCGSDTNDKGSVTNNSKENTGTRSEAQKRCHSSDDSDDNSVHENINVGSHTQSPISSSKKTPRGIV